MFRAFKVFFWGGRLGFEGHVLGLCFGAFWDVCGFQGL